MKSFVRCRQLLVLSLLASFLSSLPVSLSANPVENRKQRVFLLEIKDKKTQQVSKLSNLDKNYYRKVMYTGGTSVRNFIKENSSGQIFLRGAEERDGDIYGPLAIYYDSPSICDGTFRNHVRKRVGEMMLNGFAGASINIDDGSDQIFVFPKTLKNTCFSASAAGNRIYVNEPRNFKTSILAHETGHNLGLSHAGGLRCKDKNGRYTLGNTKRGVTCKHKSTGDKMDRMGTRAPFKHFSTLSKARLGFIEQKNIKTFNGNGIYYLNVSPANYKTSRPSLLKLPRQNFPGKDKRYDALYLEYRHDYGAYDILTRQEEGVWAYYSSKHTRPMSGIFEPTVKIQPFSENTSQALKVGKVYENLSDGYRIEIIDVNTAYATLSIERANHSHYDQPDIYNVKHVVKNKKLTLTWESENIATASKIKVSYLGQGSNPIWTENYEQADLSYSHRFTAKGIDNSGFYIYEIESIDSRGNRSKYSSGMTYLTVN